ncbi:hypothetical protein BSKO_13153 [Bryopsis sp. KO-2023]|nr:hypothetical protein BSKO_13153 [Bryopsis sp. KO-2023]
MCGIFGYYNYNVARDRKYILDTLLTGLSRLEYRGYDSAGVCVDSATKEVELDDGSVVEMPEGKPYIVKEEGKIEKLRAKCSATLTDVENFDLKGNVKNHVGIAHTRWATHGPPSVLNSHPHPSGGDHSFIVVHNGIITNYATLKEFLIKHGETFVSDTDTEVIPKLCNYVYSQLKTKVPFAKLVMEVMQQLEGAYALLFKSRHYPGELVACKRGSPLIVGVLEQGPNQKAQIFKEVNDSSDIRWRASAMQCWLSSDASAVVEHTKKVIVMEDNDILHVCGGGYGIFNMANANVDSAVHRVVQTLEIEVSQIMKGGFDHYMQKEIHEQPESLLQTMRGRVQFQRASFGNPYLVPRVNLGGLAEHLKTIRRCRRIMFVACGTSYNACLAARPTVEEMCEVPVVLELASDLLDRRCPIFRDDTCVFVSQSGETADTLQALEYAKAKGALCVGITNTVGSAISRATHCGVHINAGYEIGVASTKAYTSQILCISMMALALAEDSISKRERRDYIIDELGQLPGKVRKVLLLDMAMQQLAQNLKNTNSLLFFGRGYNYSTSLEAALKVKEVALIHSEGILAGEMKHGPLALVDETIPIVVVATRDSMYRKMQSVVQQLCARSARLVVICNEGDTEIKKYCNQHSIFIEVPETVDALQPVVNIVPLQLLSYHLTVLRGFNVDQPRNLAKSVTVTEE